MDESIYQQARARGNGNYAGTQNPFGTWLKNELRLQFNPFEFLDAGQDGRLPSYLIDQGAFELLWGDWPSILFAPMGGGKTAYRVRLARACRVGEGTRRILPIVFQVPNPADVGLPPRSEPYSEALNRALANEILLELAYIPSRFLELSAPDKRRVRGFLEAHLPVSLEYRLAELESQASLDPLVESVDPTATDLLNPPSPANIKRFCSELRAAPAEPVETRSSFEYFEEELRFLLRALGFEAAYLLVDSVDAYAETQSSAAASLDLLVPLLARLPAWPTLGLYVKLFLPIEAREELAKRFPNLLTKPVKIAKIVWQTSTLADVLHQRLRVASDGAFENFEALCSPRVVDVEHDILENARPFPRDILDISNLILTRHFDRNGQGLVEPEDVKQVIADYKGQLSNLYK